PDVVGCGDALADRDAGVGVKEPDRPELALGAVDELEVASFGADVGGDRNRAAATGADVRSDRLGSRRGEIGDDDATRTGFGEGARAGAADAAGGAGYDADFSRELHRQRPRCMRRMPGAPTAASKSGCRFSSTVRNPALSYARCAGVLPI